MSSQLIKYIPGFAGKKVLILGDLMLDEHIWSKVTRISPESPVPIADVERITHVPGGCGNVASNITALGGIPYLIGVIGEDSSGNKLLQSLAKIGISSDHLIVDKTRPTILKSRIIAGSQQMVRVDREDRTFISKEINDKIISKLTELIPKVDGVIISDYEKGVVNPKICQACIKLARKYKKPVAIDPKGEDYTKYMGATVMTPNLKEAGTATHINVSNEENMIKAGKTLFKKLRMQYILITRGREGMSLFSAKDIVHIPALPRDVFDVTGAGDTVIATLMLSLCAGAKMKEAASIANVAASIVVGKVATASCSRSELEISLEGKEPLANKVKTRKELAQIVRSLKNENQSIVFTNGCFDILHLGHVRYLREAKKLGDILIIGLNSDSSVKNLKGPDRPYISEMERAEILASLECVDFVTIFSEPKPDELIKIVRPTFHVKGGDYKISELPEKKLVESFGGKVVVIPAIEGRSTTNIVERILKKRG
ncbi:MAG: D-glycero-beta-D-manno-heptose-7-phosphate kinase [Candidatus Margulisiibacteriota bacterium]